MRTSLGISAGSEVVCSATVATAPNGAQTFDYRVVTADTAHADPGDLVASSIELMTTRISRDSVQPVGAHPVARDARPSPPGDIAVAYRDREQAQLIRSAIGRQRRDVQLIPESTAALAFLRETGLLDRWNTIAVVDIGAAGTTITVADHAEGTVFRSERSTAVSGNAIDELVMRHLLDCHMSRRGIRPNRGLLLTRSRAAKEHLSVVPAVTIDHVAGRPLKLTRVDFEELIADLLRELATFARGVFTRSPKFPEAVAVIGGSANVPVIVVGLERQLEVPVFTVPEPEAVIAKGAALVADSATSSGFTAIGPAADAPIGTFTKLAGTLAGAIVVVGLIVGYGVREFIPEPQQTHYSPTSPAQTPVPATTVPPSRATTPHVQPGLGAAGETPLTPSSTPPSLHPGPGLPQIPFPADLPRLLGPILSETLIEAEADTPASSTAETQATTMAGPGR